MREKLCLRNQRRKRSAIDGDLAVEYAGYAVLLAFSLALTARLGYDIVLLLVEVAK